MFSLVVSFPPTLPIGRLTASTSKDLGEIQVSISVPLLSREQIDQLPGRAREVVEYRKSGLSLNHIQGCPLDCAYCIRHT
jgi:hypothetical protein